MANYSVDIEVALRGVEKLREFERLVSRSTETAQKLERALAGVKKQNPYDVTGARRVTELDKKRTEFIREQNRLLNDQARLREKIASEAARANLAEEAAARGLGVKKRFVSGVPYPQGAGPAMGPGSERARDIALMNRERAVRMREGVTQYAGPIGPGPASAIRSPLGGRLVVLKELIKQNEVFERKLLRFEETINTSRLRKSQTLTDVKIAQLDRLAKRELDNSKKVNDALLKDFDTRLNNRVNRRQRRKGAISSGLIGGAFPLLFGQGAGAALGGAAGGFAGGMLGGPMGFALSLVGTTLGSSVDAFVKGAQEAGQALNSTGGALELVRDKSIFSSKQIQERAAVLESQGKVEELAALLTTELTDKIGNNGVEALQGLGKTTDETTRLWNTLTLQLQALIAGPLNALLKLVNNLLRADVNALRFKALEKDLAGDAAFEAAKKRLRGGGKTGVLSPADKAALLEEFGPKRPSTATIPVTPGDRRTITATGGGQGALQSSLRRTKALKEQAETLIKTALIQNKINNAERIGAKDLAMRLTFERDRAEIFGRYSADVAKVKDTANKQAEIDALTKKRNSELFALTLDYEGQKAAFDLKKNEAGYQQLTQLQQESYVLEQTLKGKGEEAALEVEIANAIKDIKNPAIAESVANQLRRRAGLRKEIEAAAQLKQLYANVGMTIKDGVVDAITAAVEGTKTLGEVANNVLRSIAQQMLSAGIQMLLGSITGPAGSIGGFLGKIFGGKRASGGPVKGGTSYLVGEKGPELFTPGASGMITPNHAMGGMAPNIAVNVDASGTVAEGNEEKSRQLGQALGAAVQAELIKQQRPGGLLAR